MKQKRGMGVKHTQWTKSITFGSKQFIEVTLKRLGVKAKERKIVGGKQSYELREPALPYRAKFTPGNGLLRPKIPIFGTILYKYQQDSLVRPQASSVAASWQTSAWRKMLFPLRSILTSQAGRYGRKKAR